MEPCNCHSSPSHAVAAVVALCAALPTRACSLTYLCHFPGSLPLCLSVCGTCAGAMGPVPLGIHYVLFHWLHVSWVRRIVCPLILSQINEKKPCT